MLDDPFILSALLASVLPLLVSVILTGPCGRWMGIRVAGLAITVAFVVAHVAIFSWPPLPPRSSLQKLAYIAPIGLLIGILLEFTVVRVPYRRVALLWCAAILVWIGWRQLIGLQLVDLARLGAMWLAGAFVFDRLLVTRTQDVAAPTMLLVAGIGMSVIAFIDHAASLSQLAAAVAAATGGFLLWNWPKTRYPFSIATLFGAGSAFVGVASAIVLFTPATVVALVILLGIFLLGSLRGRLAAAGPVWAPILFGLVALVPMALAVALAIFMSPPLKYY